MGDFFQNGVITTLHKLRDRPVEALEQELREFSRERPMALILPSLYSELQGEALKNIVQNLKHADYISDVVVGLDRANREQYKHAREFFSVLPQTLHVLWHDGDRLMALDQELKKESLSPAQLGKGRNAWYCFGYTLGLEHIEAVALHDCDILTHDRAMVARLFYPVANPTFGFEFCKGYYSRVNGDKLGGRMTRLFVTPLLRALKRVVGHIDYLEFMDSFRYALSGEFSMRKSVIENIRIPSDWGLEVGVLSEVYRNLSRQRVCQVDIADEYDHKHQVLATENQDGGLQRMSVEIATSLFRKLATEGLTFSAEDFRSIKAVYFRNALDCSEQYYYDARLNGLNYDRHLEESSIELFAQSIMQAGDSFLKNPMQAPFIPNWNRVLSAITDFDEQMLAAVTADHCESDRSKQRVTY